MRYSYEYIFLVSFSDPFPVCTVREAHKSGGFMTDREILELFLHRDERRIA